MQEQSQIIHPVQVQGVQPHLSSQTAMPLSSDSGISALSRLFNVDLEVRVEFGKIHLPIKDILELSHGAVIDLKKTADEPMEVYVGDKLLARGEIVMVDDSLGIRITQIAAPEETILQGGGYSR